MKTRARVSFLLAILWGSLAFLRGERGEEVRAEEPAPAVFATDERITLAETMQQDASLADVTFIDAMTGWAVGDRGVIWHTRDGGQTWVLQQSGVTCSLKSVSFVDAKRGWAAGGTTPPLAQGSRGVLLATADGGATWREVEQATLPSISRFKFFDAAHGVAAGGANALFASGVFATNDGGKTWQALAADSPGEWLAADFADLETGAVAGRNGAFATLARRRVAQASTAVENLRAYRALRLAPPTGGWLVGDGGLVMTTRDVGRSWQTPPGDLPPGAAANFDYQAVAVVDTHVWIAGTPGTRVFHSGDGGFTWQAQPTGQTAPIRAIAFVDANNGFAVGGLGSILATNDGGRTWKAQRQGGRRLAVLAVFAQASDVPLELLGKLGAEEAYLAGVDLLHPVSANEARTGEAMLLAGATATNSAWQFPITYCDDTLTAADLLTDLNKANDGRAAHLMGRHLVRQLRMWRPEVVVTHPGEPIFTGPMASLVEQLVSHSIEAAADPQQFPELVTDAGLEPWEVKRVFGVLPAGSPGEVRIVAGQFAPRLGATLADWAENPRRIIQDDSAAPEVIELQRQSDATNDAVNARDPFAGIRLIPGSEARRRLANLPEDDVEALRKMATRRRQMRKLIERSQGNAAWAGQVANLTEGLDPASTGELLFELAEGYRSVGRLDLAADTYTQLARQAPEHPLVEAALTWLVQFYASGEAAQRLATRDATNVRPEDAQPVTANAVQQASAVSPIEGDVTPVGALSRDNRFERAAALGQYLESARPALFADPNIRFPLVVAQRQRGYANPAQRYYLSLKSLPDNDPWKRCGQTEEWFTKIEDMPPPKTLGSCRRIDDRPKLDGVLNEPVWQSADRLVLKGEAAAAKDAAEVRITYDDEFMYVAARCPKVAGIDYAADEHPRPRDADLAARDHVTIHLDVDRDYTTAFEFAVDHRGWTHDACWNDATWNPTWYVAASGDATSWSIEAAIPLAQLTSEPPATRHVWAASVVRSIPRVGEETWSGDVRVAGSPDRFGLLIFE